MEKKNQNIRDDLLQEAGQMPSWSRQMDHIAKMAANKERAASLSTDEAKLEDDI
jgi:hypothetical protein